MTKPPNLPPMPPSLVAALNIRGPWWFRFLIVMDVLGYCLTILNPFSRYGRQMLLLMPDRQEEPEAKEEELAA